MTNDRKDVYSRVTDRIIADLERGGAYLDEALERRAYSGENIPPPAA